MRVLIDVSHPAHVHFFRHAIRLLRDRGDTVVVASRDKDCTLGLLDRSGLGHNCLSKQNNGNLLGMLRELVVRDRALARLARSFRPDVITGLGGICAAHVGRWLSIPSVVFYDSENARLQNALTYPIATKVVVPNCYGGWTPRHKTVRYCGYHELAYLHPSYFSPSKQVALANGLAPSGDTFLVRIVSWKANHDIGESGWSAALITAVVKRLAQQGKVVISAEGPLPSEVEAFRFNGRLEEMHHLLAFCRAYVGESATMASEAAVLGVPAVYAATKSRGYVDEQDKRYGLVKVTGIKSSVVVLNALEHLLGLTSDEVIRRHQRLLADSIDVPTLVVNMLAESADR